MSLIMKKTLIRFFIMLIFPCISLGKNWPIIEEKSNYPFKKFNKYLLDNIKKMKIHKKLQKTMAHFNKAIELKKWIQNLPISKNDNCSTNFNYRRNL